MKKLFFLTLIAALWGMSAFGWDLIVVNKTPFNLRVQTELTHWAGDYMCSNDDITIKSKFDKDKKEWNNEWKNGMGSCCVKSLKISAVATKVEDENEFVKLKKQFDNLKDKSIIINGGCREGEEKRVTVEIKNDKLSLTKEVGTYDASLAEPTKWRTVEQFKN